MWAKIKAWVSSYSKTPQGVQVSRFVRLASIGVATAVVGTVIAGTPVTWPVLLGVAVAALETSWRQVFPATPDNQQ